MKKMFIAFAMFMSCSLMMWAKGVVPTRFDERMDLMAVIWRMAGARELLSAANFSMDFSIFYVLL